MPIRQLLLSEINSYLNSFCIRIYKHWQYLKSFVLYIFIRYMSWYLAMSFLPEENIDDNQDYFEKLPIPLITLSKKIIILRGYK